MPDATSDSDEAILECARQYACLVAAFPYAHRDFKQSFCMQMLLLEQGDQLTRLVKRKRRRRLAGDILGSVKARRKIKRKISKSEAEAIRRYYATPSISRLATLSGDELSGSADLTEGWAQDKQLDHRSMIELLGWSDGMRSLVDMVGLNYMPPPSPVGSKPPLFKFLATKMRRR
ncbi:hypothetical protein BjapCC829_09695 [Bradyrhizobium barranii]|uniref:HEPN AbiU2-like domain-containing protein n=1 Tax=Bradyrhizobium barranii TaxID=2992140 RepID=A0ABY3QS24_9BRAD|nr:hypothetical protein [Bradyrhizobium japonicum]UFW88740.1 hypothetical protein BjapCC829_09695 [Bradyrhizobium japonicum]